MQVNLVISLDKDTKAAIQSLQKAIENENALKGKTETPSKKSKGKKAEEEESEEEEEQEIENEDESEEEESGDESEDEEEESEEEESEDEEEESEDEEEGKLSEADLGKVKKALKAYSAKFSKEKAVKILNKYAKTSQDVKPGDLSKLLKALKV